MNLPNICAICGDGLPAQVKALNHWEEDGALYPGLKTVYIRCTCHLLNTAFQHAVRNCPALEHRFQQIQSLIVVTHKFEFRKLIGIPVPKIPDTRWLYIYDVLHFLIANEQKIVDVPQSNDQKINKYIEKYDLHEFTDGIPSIFKHILEIFEPIKRFQLYAESEIAKYALIYPLFTQLLGILSDLSTKYTDPEAQAIAEAMNNNLHEVFYSEGRMALMKFCYGLTPSGREAIRFSLGYNTDKTPGIPDLDDFMIGSSCTHPVPAANSLKIDDEATPLDVDTDFTSEITEGDVQEAAEGKYVWDNYENFEEDSFNDFMKKMLKNRAVAEAAFDQSIDANDRYEEYQKAYLYFIDTPCFNFTNRAGLGRNNHQFWSAPDEGCRALKDLGLWAMALTPSEADIERLISRLRDTRHTGNQRTGEDLLKARIILKLYGHESNYDDFQQVFKKLPTVRNPTSLIRTPSWT